ncbi:hypothetical protein I3842_04G045300 [Carya illinoinensis]|uniref:RING-CH-type domain-containing protein n=1 Tax=Carya illinoinensis TaxID=32201 RepID=A0A922JPY9_CARIL|nr:hypothetical protein I3842_04G045300 [Carya illinoinensis]KAG6716359.1 hypothetical protein I3842_04G045300 [Carya illinoinensis]KAG6716360.1 hypothetical protein I3842_04G045300 [Carya illinoinensis]KAG6716361.1 hypothetical protein I3842_04G045300 [Carya illinoinensis]
MGDHFALLVDRLLTESTLEAAIESKYWGQQTTPSTSKDLLSSAYRMEVDSSFSPSKLVECRICHDEDEESNMETPCSCCGSLKHAHRICVQRWCNAKGDNICEICLQFMVLLLLRHTLPFIISGAGEYSLTLLTLLMLRTIGILLPIYIMVRAFTAIQRRRHHQDSHSIATSDGTNNLPQHQSRFIRVL